MHLLGLIHCYGTIGSRLALEDAEQFGSSSSQEKAGGGGV